MNKVVGFIGLGAMGASMARHLHSHGLLLGVNNRSAHKAEYFSRDLQCKHFADVANMALDCEVIVSCVTADADVLQIAQVIAQSGVSNRVLVDTSTIASSSARAAAKILRDVGCDFIDAPVSGGVEGAKNGKLSVMAGGDEKTLSRILPALNCFAARITHMGDVGAGQNTKAVNQVLVAGIAQAVCEGLALGEKLGLNSEKLIATLSAGAAQNWFLEKRGHTMLKNEFAPGFKLALLHKDLKIVQQLAEQTGIRHSVINQSLIDYQELVEQGFGNSDTSALIRLKRNDS